MGNSVTLGGDRLGSGKKQKIQLHGFERSSHDLGYVWRNTQAPGTLVPFMNMLALPGDNFDIDLNADVKTHPTLGPLFASFKLQLDVFQCPLRLYHAWLHNNKLKIGLDMSKVKLPQIELDGNPLQWVDPEHYAYNDYVIPPLDQQQINQSSILAYLGIRGIGNADIDNVITEKNAVPYLAYWDIYKNYYANKQEEIGAVIHTPSISDRRNINVTLKRGGTTLYTGNGLNLRMEFNDDYTLTFDVMKENPLEVLDSSGTLYWYMIGNLRTEGLEFKYTPFNGSKLVDSPTIIEGGYRFTTTLTPPVTSVIENITLLGINWQRDITITTVQDEINITNFPLENIDTMREMILQHATTDAFLIDQSVSDQLPIPYTLPLKKIQAADSTGQMCAYASQEGLALKTYQSDIFNNWLNSEWIDGEGGINEITAVDTTSGSFDINTLNLAQKVYDMLNRIAVSGGSYDDWMEAVYDNGGYRKAETPMYMGGLSKEIIFQEVVSTAAATTDESIESLGSLAGKGRTSDKHKGGKITIKVNEPSVIMGIVSITPRIDYYQGNDWTTLLKTMDDLHKPSLDEIGFQELVTDQMATWDTAIENNNPVLKSAGKQPAWINYMTNFNKLYGNFADERNEMYMTLARRYEPNYDEKTIKDLTTYIDPSKFNYAFAQTDLTAMNFWVQIGCDITARRKMSAKVMPNL